MNKENNVKFRLKNKIHSMVKNSDLILTDTKKIHIIRNCNDVLLECLHLWRKGGTIAQIKDEMKKISVQSTDYFSDLEHLVEIGFFEDLRINSNLSSFELEFWSRSVDYFSLFETEYTNKYNYLEKLRNSSVVLVGIGGMGSWVLYQLLCMGVGNIFVIDGDKVELSNLNRSILYKPSDVGRWKVDCAIEIANSFSPSTNIKGKVLQINSSDDLIPFLNDVDLLISCADKPYWYIQQWISEACYNKRVPFLTASGGRVGPFAIPDKTSCRMCLWAEIIEKKPELANSLRMQQKLPTARKGVLISKVVFMSSFIINEVFKFLTGLGEPLTLNAYWTEDKNFSSKLTQLNKHPDCSACGIRQKAFQY